MILHAQPNSLISVTGLTCSVTLVPNMDIIQSLKSVSLLLMQNMKLKPSQCSTPGIKVMNGYRFLGGFIGDQKTTKQFLHNKSQGG